ncbi:MAG: type IV toxin-antitoxin system AbiEi family antitoxin [Actinomycetota bacterium]
MVIPPEFQTWGSVPPDWFIDPMMEHLARGYYVGLLTAAAFHGAAHQQPQVFQVVVNKHLADRDYGRAHLRFMVSDRVPQMDVERRHTHTGTFNLATRETTLVDMAWRPQASGGISNVATVAREIGPLDGERIARLAMVRNRATARRLGWLLEQFRQDVDRHWLRVVARTDEGDATLLGPGEPKRGRTDRLWGVVVNTQVDVDL